MSFGFEQHHGLIIVNAVLAGPIKDGFLRLALDTGATFTLVNKTALIEIGYEPDSNGRLHEMTTGDGVGYAARIGVGTLSALGQQRTGLRVICHDLPGKARIDGLLGLDFMRGLRLTIDFRDGIITLH
jgi:predicted aspartyl protease